MNILNILKFIGTKNPDYAIEEKDGFIKIANENGYRNSNGMKEGYWVDYYDIDTKKVKYNSGEYVDGNRVGLWKYYYKQGELWYEESYNNNGKLNGPTTRYWLNGNIMTKGQYLNGDYDGKWEEFDENGNLTFEKFYEKGKRTYYNIIRPGQNK